jgi:zinc protease
MRISNRALRNTATRLFLVLMLSVVVQTTMLGKAKAMRIQEVRSPGGISAWLVEEHSVPLLAMRFAFDGAGSAQDPVGKEGLANFVSSMLDEGAGDLSAQRFQERMEELALRMSFEDGRDAFYGSFESLTANREEAVKLLALALNRPRFDAEAIERMRRQHLATLSSAARDPTRVATERWMAVAFPGHPYGRPANGTPGSVGSITKPDLEGFHRRAFARSNLRVVVVGDIDAIALGHVLDAAFGALPTESQAAVIKNTEPKSKKKLTVVDMNVPQSVVRFGLPAMARADKEFIPAFVLNTILGGAAFTSRLYREVRDKRGLAYGVDTSIMPMKNASVFFGGVATKNEKVSESLDVIRAELKRIVDEGPTQQELDDAKAYLTGSFALRFDSNSSIANQLLWMQLEGLGRGYVDTRNAQIEAVSLEDLKKVARRLFAERELIVTVVGRPKGLAPGG